MGKKKTVWVRNLETGLVWLVDEAHAARLVASGKYVKNAKRNAKGNAKGAKSAKGRMANGE